MQVCQIEKLQSMPTLGALVGTVTSAPIIENFNKQWGNDQTVIYGQTGDPFRDQYKNLTAVLNNIIIPTQDRVMALEQEAITPRLKPITSEEDLRNISDNMKIPILMFEPVRKLFEEDRIYGFGYDKKYLPDEDVYGRLLNNHTADYNSKHIPDWVFAEWELTDPCLTQDELDAIEESRAFVAEWIEKQTEPDGTMIDPTDLDNVIKK